MKTIQEIIKLHLEVNGYNGLHNPNIACYCTINNMCNDLLVCEPINLNTCPMRRLFDTQPVTSIQAPLERLVRKIGDMYAPTEYNIRYTIRPIAITLLRILKAANQRLEFEFGQETVSQNGLGFLSARHILFSKLVKVVTSVTWANDQPEYDGDELKQSIHTGLKALETLAKSLESDFGVLLQ